MAKKMGALEQKKHLQHKRVTLVGGVILAVAVSGWAYVQLSGQGPLNPKTLCPAQGPLGHHVLLIDKTDPLTFTQKQAFTVSLEKFIEHRVPEGYLLSVFALEEDFRSTAAPLAELCNPGIGADKSEWEASHKRLRKRYEEKFLNPLLTTSESLMATQPGKASPIFEMLQLVAINAFRKHDVKGERRLVVFSDMLHNTSQFSMFRSQAAFPAFSATDYARTTQVDLAGVGVELHYIIHSPQLQTQRNNIFWEQYFEKAGAHVVSVQPL